MFAIIAWFASLSAMEAVLLLAGVQMVFVILQGIFTVMAWRCDLRTSCLRDDIDTRT